MIYLLWNLSVVTEFNFKLEAIMSLDCTRRNNTYEAPRLLSHYLMKTNRMLPTLVQRTFRMKDPTFQSNSSYNFKRRHKRLADQVV